MNDIEAIGTLLITIMGGIFWLAAQRPAAFRRFCVVAGPVSFWSNGLLGAFILGCVLGPSLRAEHLALFVAGEAIAIAVYVTIAISRAIGLHEKP